MSEAVTSSLKTAVKGTAFVFAGMIASQALWFVTRLLIVRNLSKEDLGIYSLVVAIVSIVSMMASLGLWEGSTRYISVFLGQGRKKDADAVQRSSLRIGAIAGIGVCAVIFLFSGVLSRYVFYKPELSVPLMVISLFIPAYVMAYDPFLYPEGIRRYKPQGLFYGRRAAFFLSCSPLLYLAFRSAFHKHHRRLCLFDGCRCAC